LEINPDLGDPYPSILLASTTVQLDLYYVVTGVVFLILLILSGLISGSEVAFFSLSQDQKDQLAESDGLSEKLIHKYLARPKLLLANILVFNNLVNIGIITLTTQVSWRLSEDSGWKGWTLTDNFHLDSGIILLAAVTFLIIFFGEVIPKIYARQKSMAFAKRTIVLMRMSDYVLRPVSWLLLNLSKLVEKRIEQRGYDVSSEDLEEAIDIATEDSEEGEEAKEILKGIVHFGQVTVTQIMRPRMDIAAIDHSLGFHQLMDKINKLGFSRIPVYKDTIDKIEGILYIKDLLEHIDKEEDFKWQTILRPVFYIPESKKIDDLLKNFQAKHVHMAIVTDEYGGTSGLITLEDIIEEIVGEINDEFDEKEIEFEQINETTFTFEGKTSLNDVTKIMDVDTNLFDEHKGENESLAGLVLEVNKTLPIAGEKILLHDFEFTVESVNNKRIKRVRIEHLKTITNEE
jgi:gliding motility-associated protein GldE